MILPLIFEFENKATEDVHNVVLLSENGFDERIATRLVFPLQMCEGNVQPLSQIYESLPSSPIVKRITVEHNITEQISHYLTIQLSRLLSVQTLTIVAKLEDEKKGEFKKIQMLDFNDCAIVSKSFTIRASCLVKGAIVRVALS